MGIYLREICNLEGNYDLISVYSVKPAQIYIKIIKLSPKYSFFNIHLA